MGTLLIRLGRITVVIASITASACTAQHEADNSQHVAAIQKFVSSAPSWSDRSALAKTLWNSEQQFYASRSYMPVWIEGDTASNRLPQLMTALHGATRHGLDPARYGVADLQKQIDAAAANKGRYDVGTVPEFETRLTYAYLQHAADLLGWSGNPRAIYPLWVVTKTQDDLAARLTRAVASGQIQQTLDELAPTHPQYTGLQAALAAERSNPTGHVEAIRMNLARWRWTPRDLGDRYILVNVPAYQMQVIEGTTPVLAMRVIVGDPKHTTPLFDDEMTTVVFSPTWNVPESIIRKEMVPRLVDDPSYLDRQEIEVVGTSGDVVDAAEVDWSDEHAISGLHFRQAPGPANALGLVKFIFPNQFDVYLHDTPNDRLFNKPVRALSHGCIRVEKPTELAQYLLTDQPVWTAEKISDAMHAEREQGVALRTRIPVHIGYWTAWVGADGSVTYTDDPYGIDQKQASMAAF